MNTLQSRYANHVQDVHGAIKQALPRIDHQQLADLTNRLRDETQPIWLYEALRRRLDENQQDMEEGLYLWHDHLINPAAEVSSLKHQCEYVQGRVLSLAKKLSVSLELEGIVEVESEGTLDTSGLRRAMKTAYWLTRNMGKR